MKFVWDSVIFNTRLARPEKDAFEASSHRKELDMVLTTYMKGHLSPDPDGIISELLWDTTSTERKICQGFGIELTNPNR